MIFSPCLKPPEIMTRTQDVYTCAKELFKKHGLDEWSLKFDRAIKRAGSCDFVKHVITLSVHMITNSTISMEQIKNILLHEMAHALVGYEQGHNCVWRAKAIEIGCDGARCHSLKFTPPPRYRLSCDCGACNTTRMRFKQKSYMDKSCPKCNSRITASKL